MIGRSNRGFTIVELLVTLVIISILASAVMPMAELSVQRNKEQKLERALFEMRNAIDAYKRAGDEGRIAKKADESGYPHSLQELVDGVPDIRNPKGGKLYFLRSIPRDPFDPAVDPGKSWGKRSYASSHDEPREGPDVFDVYSLAPGVGLNGIPYREW